MTAPAMDAAGRWWGSTAAMDFIATEVVGHDAIADLAAARFDHAALDLRLQEQIRPVVDRLALLVVLATRRQQRTVAELADTFRVTASGIRRAVRVAADANALVKAGSGWGAHPTWRPAAKRIVAVELKLRDHHRALRQAGAYLRWADTAWAVFAHAPSQSALARARTRGIGVAVLSADGSLETVTRARRTGGSRDWSSAWAAEQIAQRALATN